MLALAVVMLVVDSSLIRLAVGLPLLLHVGYLAVTSLPMGTIPGRPSGSKKERQNQDLRSRVVAFLGEVRRGEEYAQRVRVGGWPKSEVDANLRSSRQRLMAAAAAVAKAIGRSPEVDRSRGQSETRSTDRSFFEVLEQSIQ